MSLADEISDVREAADLLEQGIFGMIGLGALNAATEGEEAITALRTAYVSLDAPMVNAKQIADAREAVLRGERALELLIQKRGTWWRISNIHQVPLFAYHIVFLFIFLAIGTACVFGGRWCLPSAILD
jgi:hypothetical protein